MHKKQGGSPGRILDHGSYFVWLRRIRTNHNAESTIRVAMSRLIRPLVSEAPKISRMSRDAAVPHRDGALPKTQARTLKYDDERRRLRRQTSSVFRSPFAIDRDLKRGLELSSYPLTLEEDFCPRIQHACRLAPKSRERGVRVWIVTLSNGRTLAESAGHTKEEGEVRVRVRVRVGVGVRVRVRERETGRERERG